MENYAGFVVRRILQHFRRKILLTCSYSVGISAYIRLKMSDVLMPPKAKLLLWTNSVSILRSVPVM